MEKRRRVNTQLRHPFITKAEEKELARFNPWLVPLLRTCVKAAQYGGKGMVGTKLYPSWPTSKREKKEGEAAPTIPLRTHSFPHEL